MEEGISLLEKIKQEFACGNVDVKAYSPLTLAYIGDAIYDLVVKTVVVGRGNRGANGLHKTTSKVVNAVTQATMAEAVLNLLTPEEEAVYRRGRNAKSYTAAKNAPIIDYRKATGFEALLGYLYLSDRMDRILEIIKTGLEAVQVDL